MTYEKYQGGKIMTFVGQNPNSSAKWITDFEDIPKDGKRNQGLTV